MKLSGKTALVTGASPNIMGGIAEGLAAAGAKAVCVDINPAYAHGCARSIARQGGQALGLVCDVTDEAQVIETMAWAERVYGGVDILVNGATIFNSKGVLDMPVEEWRRQTDVLLTGAFLFTKHAAQRMIAQGIKGNVINIISTAGHQGEPGNVGYSTGKGGLLNFTRSAAMELARYRIRVNSPDAHGNRYYGRRGAGLPVGGAVAGAPQGVRDKGLLPDPSAGIPLRRLPSPRHYAAAAVFLASDDAEMITAFDLRVDAGAISRYWPWDPSRSES